MQADMDGLKSRMQVREQNPPIKKRIKVWFLSDPVIRENGFVCPEFVRKVRDRIDPVDGIRIERYDRQSAVFRVSK